MNKDYENYGYAILSHVSKEKNVVGKAIDFMLDNMEPKNLDVISRAVRILKESHKEKEDNPYTNKLFSWINQEMNKQIKRDCIYYTINHDGFRM